MKGIVVGILINVGSKDYKVSYIHNGCVYEPVVDEFRLFAANSPR